MARTFQFQQPVVETVAKLQDTTTETVSSLFDTLGDNVPALPIDGVADMIGTAAEFVDAGYALVDELLKSNRKFVADLFGQATGFVSAITTSDEAAAEEAPAKKKATAKKAA